MKPRDILLWRPGAKERIGVVALALSLAAGIGYLHTLTGTAYELHTLFVIPVLSVALLVGERAGYGLALFSVYVWLLSDLSLTGERAETYPLLFNSGMRLIIFVGGAWLTAQLRQTLLREAQWAREDPLTRLANYREFYARGQQAFALAQRQAAPFTVVSIDLDRFKQVNDSLGHQVGDRLLATVAQVMRDHVRKSDIPGRLGGDEFALLLPNMDACAAEPYVEDLRQRLREAMQRRGWPVSFSIGVASYRHVPHDLDAALAQADALMYIAKNGGRDGIEIRCCDAAGEYLAGWVKKRATRHDQDTT